MRFRDGFSILAAVFAAVALGVYGYSMLRMSLFASTEINRDDARRQTASLLTEDDWVEFQIIEAANTFRLYTNAALDSIDAPDYDLENSRVGWKYAIHYELLDADRNLIRESDYHFRSTIRKMMDDDTGESIYPLFFGQSGFVSTQTRTMQIPLHATQERAAIIRIRLVSSDVEIKEVVARAVSRIPRKNFDQQQTWNRLSPTRRESLSKYCVFDHHLLTETERHSLMRWKWVKCATVGESERRFLFFIGDIDDQDVRGEQIPDGLYVDARSLATMPIPEGQANVRLEFERLDQMNPELNNGDHAEDGSDRALSDESVEVSWYGIKSTERSSQTCKLGPGTISIAVPTNGGLIEFKPTTNLVVRAFWQPLDDRAAKVAAAWSSHSKFFVNKEADHLEITPRPSFVRTWLVDKQPLDFQVSHLASQATPVRLQIRYPYGEFFNSLPIQEATDQRTTVKSTLTWDLLNRQAEIVDSGVINISPEISVYDRLSINGKNELISDVSEVFLQLPPEVKTLRMRADDNRILVNASVRPPGMPRTVRVPEDSHSFLRRNSDNRTWFGIKPVESMALIRENRSFVVGTQVRPPQDPGDDLLNRQATDQHKVTNVDNVVDAAGSSLQSQTPAPLKWERFVPAGKWIGRQMLVPQEVESSLEIAEDSGDLPLTTWFELPAGEAKQLTPFEAEFGVRLPKPKLVFAGEKAPGWITVLVDGKEFSRERFLSVRGEMDLSDLAIEPDAAIEVCSEFDARFFLTGMKVANAACFLKRTAQRIDHGQLEFSYTKRTAGEEQLTLRLFRAAKEVKQTDNESADIESRCKISVTIEVPEHAVVTKPTPMPDCTVTKKIYDLRQMDEAKSVLLGQAGLLDVGHLCFIKLGEDLPPGEYKICVDRIDGAMDGLVLLYQNRVEEPNEFEPAFPGVDSDLAQTENRTLPSMLKEQP